jgi:hypothetical protein
VWESVISSFEIAAEGAIARNRSGKRTMRSAGSSGERIILVMMPPKVQQFG